ncbi:MAG: hypothetical protein SFZ23_14985 [Planctomycetota bacterium]|nr:hypothetical protein [Planctomycetota bacterium]
MSDARAPVPSAGVAITAAGMVTGVGNTFAACAAAMRAGLDRFEETRFIDKQGQWIIASEARLGRPWRGRDKLLQMAAAAVEECLDALGVLPLRSVPLIVNLAEPDRPARLGGLDDSFLGDLASLLDARGRNALVPGVAPRAPASSFTAAPGNAPVSPPPSDALKPKYWFEGSASPAEHRDAGPAGEAPSTPRAAATAASTPAPSSLLHPASRVLAGGRVGGAVALAVARDLIIRGEPAIIVVGVDSFLVAGALASFERDHRLLTSACSDGFVPGEAGAALLLRRCDAQGVVSEITASAAGQSRRLVSQSRPTTTREERLENTASPMDTTHDYGGVALAGGLDEHPAFQLNFGPALVLSGLGFSEERATISSGEPLRADGLVAATRDALRDAGIAMHELDLRAADCNGEQYKFKEACLLPLRMLRKRKAYFDLWHTCDSVGEVGAASAMVMLAMLLAAARKAYMPGRSVLCTLGDDGPARAAMVITSPVRRGGFAAAVRVEPELVSRDGGWNTDTANDLVDMNPSALHSSISLASHGASHVQATSPSGSFLVGGGGA